MLFGTYNIHYGVGADGQYDVARIADAVADADIVCLQEVTRGWPENGHADQTAEIGKRLNRYYRFHGPMEADASTVAADGTITSRRRSFGNAIVSRWPILWSRGVMLPKTRLAESFDLQRGYIEAVIAVAVRAAAGLLHALEPRRRRGSACRRSTALMEAVQARGPVGRHLGRHGVRQLSCSRSRRLPCRLRRSSPATSTSRRRIRNIRG